MYYNITYRFCQASNENSNTTGIIDNTKLPSTLTEFSDGSFVRRCGNIVQLTLNLKYTGSGSVSIPANFIPFGYRPKYETKVLFGDGSATGQSVGTLRTDGGIGAMYIGSTGYIQGSVVYIGE